MNRVLHLLTESCPSPTCLDICMLLWPSAASKMIFARCTRRAGSVLLCAYFETTGRISSGIFTHAATNGMGILSLFFLPILSQICVDCNWYYYLIINALLY